MFPTWVLEQARLRYRQKAAEFRFQVWVCEDLSLPDSQGEMNLPPLNAYSTSNLSCHWGGTEDFDIRQAWVLNHCSFTPWGGHRVLPFFDPQFLLENGDNIPYFIGVL